MHSYQKSKQFKIQIHCKIGIFQEYKQFQGFIKGGLASIAELKNRKKCLGRYFSVHIIWFFGRQFMMLGQKVNGVYLM